MATGRTDDDGREVEVDLADVDAGALADLVQLEGDEAGEDDGEADGEREERDAVVDGRRREEAAARQGGLDLGDEAEYCSRRRRRQ